MTASGRTALPRRATIVEKTYLVELESPLAEGTAGAVCQRRPVAQ